MRQFHFSKYKIGTSSTKTYMHVAYIVIPAKDVSAGIDVHCARSERAVPSPAYVPLQQQPPSWPLEWLTRAYQRSQGYPAHQHHQPEYRLAHQSCPHEHTRVA